MHIAVITFDGFNEIDSFVSFHILNRVDAAAWKAEITSPSGLLQTLPACTDFMTRPVLEAAGVPVLDQTFFASGNIASAGRGRAVRDAPHDQRESALSGAIPVGHRCETSQRLVNIIRWRR